MRRLLLTLTVALLASAGLAAAAPAGTVSVTVSPNRAGAVSTMSVVAHGPFTGGGGLPTSVILDVQRGFKSDPRAVAVLCTMSQASKSSCPGPSKVGSGDASVHVTTALPAGVGSGDYDIPFELFLGAPRRAGDLAAVVIEAHAPQPVGNASATGRLLELRSGAFGLELRFENFPQAALPPGTRVTLNKLTLVAGASRTVTSGKGKHRRARRYALVTNPLTCHGVWDGRLTATFTSGPPLSQALITACRKH